MRCSSSPAPVPIPFWTPASDRGQLHLIVLALQLIAFDLVQLRVSRTPAGVGRRGVGSTGGHGMGAFWHRDNCHGKQPVAESRFSTVEGRTRGSAGRPRARAPCDPLVSCHCASGPYQLMNDLS